MAVTILELVNRCLDFSGQRRVTADEYNTDNENRYQCQIREFLRFADSLILMRMNEPWSQRRFELGPTTAGTHTYPLADEIGAESLVPHSVICLTAGSLGSIRPWKGGYNAWRATYNDESLVQQAMPTWWFELPAEAADVVRVPQIRLFPTPDSAYLYEYQAKLNAPDLSASTAQLIWPEEYIAALEAAGVRLLEWALRNGGDPPIQEMATQAILNVKQFASSPSERPRGVRMAVSIGKSRYRRGYGTESVGRAGWD